MEPESITILAIQNPGDAEATIIRQPALTPETTLQRELSI